MAKFPSAMFEPFRRIQQVMSKKFKTQDFFYVHLNIDTYNNNG